VVGYNLYAEFNAYSEYFNPDTSLLRGWKIVIKGNSTEPKACLLTLRYLTLTDYYTGWRVYPGGANYTGGDGYGGPRLSRGRTTVSARTGGACTTRAAERIRGSFPSVSTWSCG